MPTSATACCETLLASLKEDPDYQVVYDAAGVKIFAKHR
jgi:hypothetical protein